MSCWVYIILCKSGTLYTGVSDSFINRWLQHFKGCGARYVRNNGFDKPVFLQKVNSKSEAMCEEKFIKQQGRLYKQELILSDLNILNKNPDFVKASWLKQGRKGKPPWE